MLSISSIGPERNCTITLAIPMRFTISSVMQSIPRSPRDIARFYCVTSEHQLILNFRHSSELSARGGDLAWPVAAQLAHLPRLTTAGAHRSEIRHLRA